MNAPHARPIISGSTLTTLALATSTAGAVAFAVSAEVIDEGSAPPIAVAVVAIVAALAGALVLRRAPGRDAAGLQLLAGWLLLSLLRQVDLGTAGLVITGSVWLAGASIPAWLLDGGGDRPRSMAVLTSVGALLGVAAAVLGGAAGPGVPTSAAGGPWNPDNAIQTPLPPLARLAFLVQSIVVVAVIVIGLLRARRSRRGIHPGLGALTLFGVALVVERVVHALPPTTVFETGGGHGYRPGAFVVAVNFPVLASAVVVGTVLYLRVAEPRLVRLPTGSLMLQAERPDALVERIRDWVGDPSLRIGTEIPSEPAAGETVVRVDGRPAFVIHHDPALSDAPEHLSFVAATLSSALDAEAHALTIEQHSDAVSRAAARLLVADVTARRALLDELETSALGALRDTADDLWRGGDLADATDAVAAATAQIRRISHGVYPPELRDGGLAAVFDGQRGTPRRRLDKMVEMTAFLLARDDPTAVFAEESDHLVIRRADAVTDQDLLDRIAALDGTTQRHGDHVVISLPGGTP